MKKLVLRCNRSPGDIVMLTAAVRDLHRLHPGKYITDIRTPCPELWENNPYLTWLGEDFLDVRVVDCECPLVQRSNELPYHYIHGFQEFLSEQLGIPIKPTAFKGDIHLSDAERRLMSPIAEVTNEENPYWIICAGGKRDFTIKWWDTARYQQVVNHFRGRIQFVQVGAAGHFHPGLDGVIDLRAKTSLRELIRLVYHSQGVITPVSLLMHLAAAVEMKGGGASNTTESRPCVVIAGGREPVQWEAYPTHQFLHTVGMIPCCRNGGCWRSRTRPLNDESRYDAAEHLCTDTVGSLPRCMDIISAEAVIGAVENYSRAAPADIRSKTTTMHKVELSWTGTCVGGVIDGAVEETGSIGVTGDFRAQLPEYPGGFQGTGVVICISAREEMLSAWICVQRLRNVGCRLPIELWYLDDRRMDSRVLNIFTASGINCINSATAKLRSGTKLVSSISLRQHAVVSTQFKRIILLEANSIAARNPEFLMRSKEFRLFGAVFWHADTTPSSLAETAQKFATNQIIVDKERCWKALSLALHFAQGNLGMLRTDSFEYAFREMNIPVTLLTSSWRPESGVSKRYDMKNRLVFEEVREKRWNLFDQGSIDLDLESQAECVRDLDILRIFLHEQDRNNGDLRSAAFLLKPAPKKSTRVAPITGIPKYTISVLCHNRLDLTRKCIESVVTNSGAEWELIVTDNASTDGTAEWLQKLEQRLGNRLKIVSNPENLGFIKPNNHALTLASGEFFVTLNNDLTVCNGWLEALAAPFNENSKCGATGISGTCCGFDDNFHGIPSPKVEYIEGSCLMIPTAIARAVGLFSDYLTFAYCEDADLSLRLRQQGYEIATVSLPISHHARGATAKIVSKSIDLRAILSENLAEMKRRWAIYIRKRHFQTCVLVQRRGARGDVLLLTPVLRAISEKWPQSRIVVKTEHPEILTGSPWLATKETPQQGFDFVFHLDSAYESKPDKHIVEAYAEACSVALREGWRIEMFSTRADENWATRISRGKPYALVHAGPTTWPGKNWPINRIESVVMALRRRGFLTISVGAADSPLAGCDLTVAGRTTPQQLYELARRASVFVGLDSFPQHVASAADCPGVVLFGATNPKCIIRPLSRIAAVQGPEGMAECIGEHGRRTGPLTFLGCDGACMRAITVPMVLDAIERVLNV